MVRLFDTHAHFEGSAEESAVLLARAADAGVTDVCAIGGSPALNAGARASGAKYLALGYDRDTVAMERPPIDYTGVSAVGEIALDYHYSPETRAAQRALFAEQLELSRKLDLPVVIHTREADDDTLGLLREIPARGIIHCFTGSPAFGRRLLDLGYFISISGIVTFRKADNVRETALAVPDDRLLIETDSPYLAPIPHRGVANEPAFLVETAKFLAGLRGVSFGELAEMTYRNALRAYGGVSRGAAEPQRLCAAGNVSRGDAETRRRER